MKPSLPCFLATSLFVLGAVASTPQAIFTGLGDLSGGDFSSSANGVSGDGTTVTGTSDSSNGSEAYYWKDGLGMTGIGDLAGGQFSSNGRASNTNGTFICGSGTAGIISNPINLATRWDPTSGMIQLGSLNPSGFKFSSASGVTSDGQQVVGSSSSPLGFRAFLWTASSATAGNLTSLGALIPTPTQTGDRVGLTSSAAAITPDGSHIVGNSGYTVSTVETIQPPPITIPAVNPETGDPILDQNGNPTFVTIIPDPYDVETVVEQGTEAFVWTPSGGMVGLGDLPDGPLGSEALAISSNGSIIVGAGQTTEGQEAVIWRDGVIEALGDLPGGLTSSRLVSLSSDGSIAVGQGTNANGTTAMIWNDAFGIGDIKALLSAQGLDMEGWQLSEATGISEDGQVIVGNGINPAGDPEAWRITDALTLVNILIPTPEGLQESMKVLRGKAAQFTAERGRNYQLLESPNMSTWTPEGGLYSTANAGESFTHALPISSDHAGAFYLLGPSADPATADTPMSIVEGSLLQFTSERGYNYSAEYSDDMITWTGFGDTISTSSDLGPVNRVFVDTSAPLTHTKRFYRIQTSPTAVLTVPFDLYVGDAIGVTAPLGQDYQIQRSEEFSGGWINFTDFGPAITTGNSATELDFLIPIQPFNPSVESYRIISIPDETVQANGLLSPEIGAVISFTSQPGSIYQVQRTLDGTTFTNVGDAANTTGDTGPVLRMVLDDYSQSTPVGVSYRVVESPIE